MAGAAEVLEENRFLAARDGIDARLIDVTTASRVPARVQLEELLEVCEPHSDDLGSRAELDELRALMESPGAVRQRATMDDVGQRGLVESLASAFLDAGAIGKPASVIAGGEEA